MSNTENRSILVGDRVKWIGCKTTRPEFGYVTEVFEFAACVVDWDRGVNRVSHIFFEELEVIKK